MRHNTALTLLRKKHGRHGPGLAGAVGRWAAGGGDGEDAKGEDEREGEERERVLRMWRESVVWYLRRGLGEAGETQRGMMERRVEREVERGRSVLYLAKKGGGMEGLSGGGAAMGVNGGLNGGAVGEGEGGLENQLSAEQLQIFAQENNELLRHYEDTLDQVRYVPSLVFPLTLILPLPSSFTPQP